MAGRTYALMAVLVLLLLVVVISGELGRYSRDPAAGAGPKDAMGTCPGARRMRIPRRPPAWPRLIEV